MVTARRVLIEAVEVLGAHAGLQVLLHKHIIVGLIGQVQGMLGLALVRPGTLLEERVSVSIRTCVSLMHFTPVEALFVVSALNRCEENAVK